MIAKIKSFFFPVKLFLLKSFTRFWIKRYLKDSRIKKKKLQFACGTTSLKGWLNSDLSSKEYFARRRLYIDVTRPLQIADNTFDFLYAEHLIEHLTIENGQAFLKECHRILKPGGVLRLSFPSLEFICSFYLSKEPWTKDFLSYWSNSKNLADYGVPSSRIPVLTKADVVNMFFSEWGHKTLYDLELIEKVLSLAGFEAIAQLPNGKSCYLELCDIETRKFAEDSIETATPYVIEATKKESLNTSDKV